MRTESPVQRRGAMVFTVLLLTLSLAATAAPAARSQDEPEEPAPRSLEDPGTLHFDIARATSEIKVDAHLDEDAWEDAGEIPLAYEWFPGDNVPPPVETTCLVAYDDQNLYVAFIARDPRPEEIRAHLMDRDNVRIFVQNDHVGFQVDPFNDERRAFQFRINPLGVQVDAVFSEIDQLEDFSWDAIWSSRGRITADGYVVEVAVPLEQLRFP
ncbi:MAG: carbohydrate binding family 9 domain-containing protein, partial [Acidobacteriota bacterium]